MDESEAEAARLEQAGRYSEALALCERLLAELAESAGDPEAMRLETQLNQRRLRLRRKLGLPTWSSTMRSSSFARASRRMVRTKLCPMLPYIQARRRMR